MNGRNAWCFKAVAAVLCSLLFVACATGNNKSGYVAADKVGRVVSAIEAQDIIACAEDLGRDLLQTPEVAAAKPYARVALRSIQNFTDFEIDTNLLSGDIRHQLMRYGGDRIRFVERTRDGQSADIPMDVLVERDQKNEGFHDFSKEAPLAGVDFFLRGEIRAHSVVSGNKRDDTLWYYCWLADAETGELVWEHRYGPVRKLRQTPRSTRERL